MSDLQLGLLAIGVLVVAGVAIYNRLQERAAQRRTDAALRSTHPDALTAGEGASVPRGGAGVAPAIRGAAAESRPEPVDGREAVLDPRLDYLVELEAAEPVAISAVFERWTAIAHRYAGRGRIESRRDDGRWSSVTSGAGSARQLRAGLQLVSRAGVTGEAELIEFRSDVENLAAQGGLVARAPEMKAALEAARALDAFCADRDVQVALHVVAKPGDGLSREVLLGQAERFALAPQADGSLSHDDALGRTLFRLSDRSGARLDAATPLAAISLSMDVPRTPDTARSFEAMSRVAVALAADLGGAIVDDNGRVLDERALAAIEAQLATIRAELEARGFPPGEALAARLFG